MTSDDDTLLKLANVQMVIAQRTYEVLLALFGHFNQEAAIKLHDKHERFEFAGPLAFIMEEPDA